MEQDQENKDNNNVLDKSVGSEQTPELPGTPVVEESVQSEVLPIPKKKNRRILFLSIASVFLLLTLTLGVVLWQKSQTPAQKGQAPSPTPTTTLSQEDLQITQGEVAESEREIAYLQGGKMWFISNDLAKKMEYQPAGSATAITSYDFSSDGQELYWVTEAGELWKMDKSGESNPLVTQANDMTSVTFEDPITETVTTYQKGKVAAFYLSPNGEYIAYETLETFTGCCMSPYDIPVYKIRIMKNDGTSKAVVNEPSGVTRSMLFFDGWFSNSQKVLFHFSAPDEATQGSPFYEVGVAGNNPGRFTGIDFVNEELSMQDELSYLAITIAGAVPVFSPDGEKMAYVEGGIVGEGKSWLSNIDGTDKRPLTTDGEYSLTDFSWSNDGRLLLVNSDSVGKFTVFNQQAEILYQTSIEQENKNDSIRSIITPNNKYVAVSSGNKLLVIDLNTKEKKELSIPTPNDQILIYPQLITENGRLYYLRDTNQETKGSYPQLWVIDATNLKDYKIADNVSSVEYIPSK
jgi:Tol biopolymer transport system component